MKKKRTQNKGKKRIKKQRVDIKRYVTYKGLTGTEKSWYLYVIKNKKIISDKRKKQKTKAKKAKKSKSQQIKALTKRLKRMKEE